MNYEFPHIVDDSSVKSFIVISSTIEGSYRQFITGYFCLNCHLLLTQNGIESVHSGWPPWDTAVYYS